MDCWNIHRHRNKKLRENLRCGLEAVVLFCQTNQKNKNLLFAKESIKNPQSLKYYSSIDTSATCCACINRGLTLSTHLF